MESQTHALGFFPEAFGFPQMQSTIARLYNYVRSSHLNIAVVRFQLPSHLVRSALAPGDPVPASQ